MTTTALENSAESGTAAAEARFAAAKKRAALRRRVLPVVGLVAMIALWAAVVHGFGVRPFVAPSPFVVVQTLVAKFAMLMDNLKWTALEAVLGFLLGNFVAIVAATLFVHFKSLEETFFPIVVLINTIPVVAKAPILVLLLGNGIEPKIAVAALICFFPTLVNMVRGLEAVSPQQLELMRVLSASKREVFLKLRLYNALPYLFSALKISASTATIGAIVGEWVSTTVGIGALIVQAMYAFDSALLYATVLVGSGFAFCFFLLITAIERMVVRWQAPTVT
ncbi:MAG: ABC transporter permease [Alphaproteobacteria bacterium]|nr:ABC transporter permease [Alphaproteobacteria bacterium]